MSTIHTVAYVLLYVGWFTSAIMLAIRMPQVMPSGEAWLMFGRALSFGIVATVGFYAGMQL